jgi:hypothetical protein
MGKLIEANLQGVPEIPKNIDFQSNKIYTVLVIPGCKQIILQRDNL